MPSKDHDPVLGDHVRVKRKLLSPFLARVGGIYAPFSWNRQLVPEALWLALVIDYQGLETATRVCVDLAITAAHIVDRVDAPMFTKFSAYAELSEAQSNSIVATLSDLTLTRLRTALAPLSKLIPQHPLSFLFKGQPYECLREERLIRVLDELYDRNSRLSVLSMALAYYLGSEQGKMKVSSHLIDDLIKSFQVIHEYPTSEAARQAAGRFRAAAPMLFMSADLEHKSLEVDKAWVKLFWEHVAGFGACAFDDGLFDESMEESEEA